MMVRVGAEAGRAGEYMGGGIWGGERVWPASSCLSRYAEIDLFESCTSLMSIIPKYS